MSVTPCSASIWIRICEPDLTDVAASQSGRVPHDGKAVGIDFFLDDLEFRDLVGADGGICGFGRR